MTKNKYKLKINGIPVKLSYVDVITYEGENEAISFPYGIYYDRTKEIEVVNNIGKEFIQWTTIHELIHAILVPYSLNMEEYAIDILSNGILQFSKQNKAFFKELFDV